MEIIRIKESPRLKTMGSCETRRLQTDKKHREQNDRTQRCHDRVGMGFPPAV